MGLRGYDADNWLGSWLRERGFKMGFTSETVTEWKKMGAPYGPDVVVIRKTQEVYLPLDGDQWRSDPALTESLRAYLRENVLPWPL